MTMSEQTMKKLAELDQEIRQKQKELAALLRETTDHKPVQDYELMGPDGPVRLSELFGDKDDLIVVHNMGASCPYCTLWADGFKGLLPHLESRAAFVVVSPDKPEAQQKFAAGRGWQFRMVSNADSTFTENMGYRFEKDGKTWHTPGFSTFRRSDGEIRRVSHAPFGPGDAFCSVWHIFGALDGGTAEWSPKYNYS